MGSEHVGVAPLNLHMCAACGEASLRIRVVLCHRAQRKPT